MTSSPTLRLPSAGPAEITVQDHDRTRTFLLLHGGGGVATMAGFADLLAERTRSRVLLPTHPGFNGTPKAAGLTDVTALAKAYIALLDHLDVSDVTVVGNSFGGWLAAEIALLHSPRVSRAVVVDGIGIEVAGHPLADVRGKTVAEIQQFSFHDPAKAPVPPAGRTGPSPDVVALVGYTGPAMTDPTLAERLGKADIPIHVLWGESDRIADPRYGEAYAAAIPGATFTVLPRTGHLPQVETPEELLGAVLAFDT
ncbi:alpha/beta hydrolase [Amycolatopsis rubida]|uniref:Alpha/beta hydrolase n=1 Tax=Amycolatopsis rubida TaxID=112413 RepID=A0ABX0BNH6_9PSEU|nr:MULTISPECIES: alpha/beta hydrolase [Amycolatopsis]MYW90970.1 alpha/beta fold hydrolase [Amycolatopsis rubida]NEC55955.1 alpha/beta hydrolase [Amycolatopsis rubida]OAP25961.1 2-hydroxymuconate semialdehyde hydrolase [Amycolatopsis sp. M39]